MPTFLCEYFLRPNYPVTHGLFGDWFTIWNYLWLFICGYLFAKEMKTSWPVFSRMKYITLCLGIVAFICFQIPALNDVYLLKAALRTVNMWCWLFTLVGIAIDFLHTGSKWLSYANEAVYPFYILHQTAIIGIGYYIRNLEMSIFVKFLIVAGGTTLICWVLYEFLIKRIGILRFLFGMRSRTTDSKSNNNKK